MLVILLGLFSAHLAVRKRPLRGRPGEPRPPSTTGHLQTQEEASAASWARPLVCAVRGVEGLAETTVRGSPRWYAGSGSVSAGTGATSATGADEAKRAGAQSEQPGLDSGHATESAWRPKESA